VADLPVDADDRAEPVIVLHGRREDRSVILVFNDDVYHRLSYGVAGDNTIVRQERRVAYLV